MALRFCLLFCGLLLGTACSKAAELPHGLKLIPSEAAIFVHVDVAKVWGSPIGEQVRKAKAKMIENNIAEFTKYTGLKLDDVETFTLWIPRFQDPRDTERLGVCVTFRKDYDAEAMRKQIKTTPGKRVITDVKGIVSVSELFAKEPSVVFDLSEKRRIILFNEMREEFRKVQPVNKQAPLAKVYDLVQKGSAVVFGFNFDQFPAEVRAQDNMPPEARSFLPLILAKTVIGSADIAKDTTTFQFRFQSKDKTNAIEVEKSLEAVRTFLKLVTETGIPRAQIDDEFKVAMPLVKMLVETLGAGTIARNDTETSATLKIPTTAPLVPFLQYVFGGTAGNNARDQNNLRQLALGMHNYESAFGQLPLTYGISKKGKKLLSWRVEMLPFIEGAELYKKFKRDEPWDSEHNMKVYQENPMPAAFVLPGSDNEKTKLTHYQVFSGNGAMFDPVLPVKILDVTDGLSNTLMIFTAKKAVPWTAPDDPAYDAEKDPTPLILFNKKRSYIALGDGSVRTIKDTISKKSLHAIITRAGGEVANIDDE